MTFEIIFVRLTGTTYQSERDIIGENCMRVIDSSEILVWYKIWILVIVYLIGVLGDNCYSFLSSSFEI